MSEDSQNHSQSHKQQNQNQNQNQKKRAPRGGRQNDSPDVKLSKALSYILRHGAEKEKITMRSDGYVKVSDILIKPKFKQYTFEDVQRVVETNEKKRFALIQGDPDLLDSENIKDWYIRANQGHSIKTIEVEMKPLTKIEDFPVSSSSSSSSKEESTNKPESSGNPITTTTATRQVVHGTNLGAWEKIQASGGLSHMGRKHIHMASGLFGESHVVSGMRAKADVFIYVDIEKALKAGIPFWLSENGVILSEGNSDGKIPIELFEKVQQRDKSTKLLVDVPIQKKETV